MFSTRHDPFDVEVRLQRQLSRAQETEARWPLRLCSRETSLLADLVNVLDCVRFNLTGLCEKVVAGMMRK